MKRKKKEKGRKKDHALMRRLRSQAGVIPYIRPRSPSPMPPPSPHENKEKGMGGGYWYQRTRSINVILTFRGNIETAELANNEWLFV